MFALVRTSATEMMSSTGLGGGGASAGQNDDDSERPIGVMTNLTIEAALEDPDASVDLDARRFNRHTFWVGQSGSGKTYALGVVLEQLLLHTELPMLILDPNGDFTRLPETRASAGVVDADRMAELDIRVFRSGAGEGERLHVRYVDLSPASKAAVLQMDPIADAEEYNALLHEERDARTFDGRNMLPGLRASGDPARVRLANRMENLQVLGVGTVVARCRIGRRRDRRAPAGDRARSRRIRTPRGAESRRPRRARAPLGAS